jgi:putative membrane protein
VKTLILCVDRDDDLGAKAGIETPVLGRRRVLEAATQLGVEDPEDSDTNALFACVKLYDKELKALKDPSHQVEVAAIAGHRLVGLKSDRILAKQLEEVLELSRADEVVLVSDGAEDEQILPILTSRVKVAHVHRSIVKQVPRLEGFYYILTRMLDDDKLAKRYVLPLGLIMLVWGFAFGLGRVFEAMAITLGIAGMWLVIHAMHWEDRITGFFRDVREEIRTGRVSWVGNAALVVLWLVGGNEALETVNPEDPRTRQVLLFLQEFLWWFLGGLVLRTGGRLIDEWARIRQPSIRHWSYAIIFIASGLLASVLLSILIGLYDREPMRSLLTFDLVYRLAIGLAIAFGGGILIRYFRNFAEPRAV